VKPESEAYGTLNYNHPEVKGLVKEFYTGAVKAYRELPALYGYDIWNETRFESYDRHTLAVFQSFLKGKYGRIEALNNAWERTFSNFDTIDYPYWGWASVTPMADLYDFRRENIGYILREWKAYINEADKTHPVLADNIGSVLTDKSLFYTVTLTVSSGLTIIAFILTSREINGQSCMSAPPGMIMPVYAFSPW